MYNYMYVYTCMYVCMYVHVYTLYIYNYAPNVEERQHLRTCNFWKVISPSSGLSIDRVSTKSVEPSTGGIVRSGLCCEDWDLRFVQAHYGRVQQ